uniref:Uncharacterized protein n=1 Tax=Brassica campestris TaxID=3711 RepID=M4CST0_BRACM
MGLAITVALPNCGTKFLPRRKGAFSLAVCFEFCSLCHFLHPARPSLVRRQSSDLGRGNTTEKPGSIEWTVTSKT